jgi:SAM-dependent methyltransferase
MIYIKVTNWGGEVIVICPICNKETNSVTYIGKIRNGAPGQMTNEDVTIYRCIHCKVIWHESISSGCELYQTDKYRESMGEAVTLTEFYQKHDTEIIEKLNYTGTSIYRNKLFMDIGCGGGGFADFIRGVAEKVVLVEPNFNFSSQLRQKGYEVFSYAEDAFLKYSGRIELITSFDVIEHVEDPCLFLQAIHSLLALGGVAYVGTPTEYPVLRSLLSREFDSFVFSVQHQWVLSKQSLEIMARKCNYSECSAKFYQRFGLGNLIAWLQQRSPLGEKSYDFITKTMNANYKSEMASEETAEYIVIELRK